MPLVTASSNAAAPQAVKNTFQGHATVQLQGSTAKGTAVQDKSDWDFFVRLDATITAVTKNQGLQVAQQLQESLAARGIRYKVRLGENRIQLLNGSFNANPLPGVDVIYERFKDDVRVAPDSAILADSYPGE